MGVNSKYPMTEDTALTSQLGPVLIFVSGGVLVSYWQTREDHLQTG